MKVSDLSRGTGAWKADGAANWLTTSQLSEVKPVIVPAMSTVFAKIGEGLKAERCRITIRPTAIDNNMMAAIPNESTDPKFLYYLMKVIGLSSFVVGSALPYLKQSTLTDVPVEIPDFREQRAIAEVLGALDDKIAANDAVTRGADKLGRAFFAALPKDELAPLSSVAQFVNGKAFTKNATGTGRVVVRIAELNSGIGGSTVYNDIEVSEQHLARPGDILFAWSGSLTLHRWYRDEAIVNQHIFKVIPHEGRPPWLVWDLIASKLEEFRAIAADKATTMGHIQRRHLDEPVRIPTAEVIAQSNAKMTALWDRALAAERENLALAATRDSLLLGLMSGKLRVRDAEGVLDRLV